MDFIQVTLLNDLHMIVKNAKRWLFLNDSKISFSYMGKTDEFKKYEMILVLFIFYCKSNWLEFGLYFWL